MKVIVNDIRDLTELKRDKIINRFCNIGYDVVLDIVDLNFLKNLHKTQMEVFIKEKLIMEKVLFVSGSHWLMMTILMMMIDRNLAYVLLALGLAVLAGLGIVAGQVEVTPLGPSGMGF